MLKTLKNNAPLTSSQKFTSLKNNVPSTSTPKLISSVSNVSSTRSEKYSQYAVFRSDQEELDESSSEDSDEENLNNEQENVDPNANSSPLSTSVEERAKKYRPRGPNKCKNLSSTIKVIVKVNQNGQPYGPSSRKLSSYLGLLARDPKLVPLDLKDWRTFKTNGKEEVFCRIILTRFIFEGPYPKAWIMDKLNHCLRSWRKKLKNGYYKPDERTLDKMINEPNNRVDPDKWKNLVNKWVSDNGKACSKRNYENRMKLTMVHHLGTKTLATLRDEMTTKDGKEPDRIAVFEKAYGESKSKPVDPISKIKLADVKNQLEMLPPDCDISLERDRIFDLVVGEDKRGYKRTYGIGVKFSTTGRSRHLNVEALQLVEEEIQKRRDLEEEVASEKQRRLELEQEVATEADKRKELEEKMVGEKRKRESLEMEVNKMKEILLQLHSNTIAR